MKYTHANVLNAFFVFLAFASFITTAYFFYKYSQNIVHWVDQVGWLAPFLFILIYTLATLTFLPTMVLTFAGGAIFGPFFGIILNLFGATCGAALSFLVTRHLISDWFSRKKGTKISQLMTQVDQKGWIIVAFLRLFPIIPFNLVNYGLGITTIKFRLYLIITFIFLIPAEVIYTYLGYAGMEALLKQETLFRNSAILIASFIVLIVAFMKLLNVRFYSNSQN